MASDRSEFEKLLSEAPEAPGTDTVSVAGALARTQDKGQFVLTLADGQTFTLPVEAVKSAKSLAGGIGQSYVQLELDAKQVPEKLTAAVASTGKFPPWDPTLPRWDHPHLPKVKWDETIPGAEQLTAAAARAPAPELFTVPIVDYTVAWVDHLTAFYFDTPHTLPAADFPPTKIIGDPQGGTIQETAGQPGLGGDPAALAPFVAAMPHQASPATIAALMQGLPLGYTHHIADRPKLPIMDGTPPWPPAPPYRDF